MKKVFALLSIVAMFSMVACGPSNQEKEEAERKRIEDSTNTADSLATIAAEQAAMEAAAADTTAADTTAPAEGTEHEGH